MATAECCRSLRSARTLRQERAPRARPRRCTAAAAVRLAGPADGAEPDALSSSASRRGVLAAGAAGAALAAARRANAVDALALGPAPEVVELAGGSRFPAASFGLQVYGDDVATELTLDALDVGYHNFFSSVLARNQRGFARAVQKSGVPRQDIYICGSVLSNSVRGYDAAKALSRRGCEENLAAMAAGGIETLDMIMLDYPGPDADSIRGQWAALEDMKAKGQVKDLAVSNFSPAQLDVVLEMGGSAPLVNQLPFSIANPMPGALEANAKRGVLVQSWSPLSRVTRRAARECAAVGEPYGKSAYQVALRWIVQSGATFTTQSRSKAHFAEDLDVFSWSLTEAEMARVAKAGIS